jgi:hypothetical protein
VHESPFGTSTSRPQPQPTCGHARRVPTTRRRRLSEIARSDTPVPPLRASGMAKRSRSPGATAPPWWPSRRLTGTTSAPPQRPRSVGRRDWIGVSMHQPPLAVLPTERCSSRERRTTKFPVDRPHVRASAPAHGPTRDRLSRTSPPAQTRRQPRLEIGTTRSPRRPTPRASRTPRDQTGLQVRHRADGKQALHGFGIAGARTHPPSDNGQGRHRAPSLLQSSHGDCLIAILISNTGLGGIGDIARRRLAPTPAQGQPDRSATHSSSGCTPRRERPPWARTCSRVARTTACG